jgi:hypothetical protein
MEMGASRRRASTVSSPGSPEGVMGGSPSSLLRLRHPNDVALNSLPEETILEMGEEGRIMDDEGGTGLGSDGWLGAGGVAYRYAGGCMVAHWKQCITCNNFFPGTSTHTVS